MIQKDERTQHLYLVCDGSSSGGRGPGGWAALTVYKSLDSREGYMISGHEQETTNSRMELTAVLRGVKALLNLHPGVHISIITDSEYVINVVSGTKIARANLDLVDELKALYLEGNLEFSWVRGHSSNRVHDLVDKTARQEYLKAKETKDIH